MVIYTHILHLRLQGLSSLATSTHSDSVVTRRQRSKRTSNENKTENRRSLGSTTSASAVGWSSAVFGKLKSLWTVQSTAGSFGLSLLAGTKILSVFTLLMLFFGCCFLSVYLYI